MYIILLKILNNEQWVVSTLEDPEEFWEDSDHYKLVWDIMMKRAVRFDSEEEALTEAEEWLKVGVGKEILKLGNMAHPESFHFRRRFQWLRSKSRSS